MSSRSVDIIQLMSFSSRIKSFLGYKKNKEPKTNDEITEKETNGHHIKIKTKILTNKLIKKEN